MRNLGQEEAVRFIASDAAPSPASDSGCQPATGHEVREVLPEGRHETQSIKGTPKARASLWHASDIDPPANYHPSPLCGEQWQIVLALQRVAILGAGTEKELKAKLKNGVFWGARGGRNLFWVFVTKKYRQEQVEQAAAELKRIKQGGRYHPDSSRLPRGYKQYEAYALHASSEALLAHVLQNAGILQQATVSALHRLINKRSLVFAKYNYNDGIFSLYLHEKYEATVVQKAQQFLQSAKPSATLMESETGQ